MHKRTILCVDRNGDILKGIVHSVKFHVNNNLFVQWFLLNCFDEEKIKSQNQCRDYMNLVPCKRGLKPGFHMSPTSATSIVF